MEISQNGPKYYNLHYLVFEYLEIHFIFKIHIELNWYVTGKVSKIIRDNMGAIFQNMTAEQQDCEGKITLVSDTCFECNRYVYDHSRSLSLYLMLQYVQLHFKFLLVVLFTRLISEQQIANAERVELVLGRLEQLVLFLKPTEFLNDIM